MNQLAPYILQHPGTSLPTSLFARPWVVVFTPTNSICGIDSADPQTAPRYLSIARYVTAEGHSVETLWRHGNSMSLRFHLPSSRCSAKSFAVFSQSKQLPKFCLETLAVCDLQTYDNGLAMQDNFYAEVLML